MDFRLCPPFQILPNLPGTKINEYFDLVRPLVEFRFDFVLARQNNIFEIMTVEPIDALLKVTMCKNEQS